MPRILLLTGNQLRHRYVAHRLMAAAELVGVLSEAKPSGQPSSGVIADHFLDRDRVEHKLLPWHDEFPATTIHRVASGAINSREAVQWVKETEPDVIVLFGTGIIGEPMMHVCPGRTVNLHLGLSPWYRGAGTNFWPFVAGQPECVGATIHAVESRVDAGPILFRVRPDWDPRDGIHEAGTKTLMAAVAELVGLISHISKGAIQGQSQDLSVGRVYRQKDFDAAAVQTARERLRCGLIRNYLDDKLNRDAAFPVGVESSVVN